MNSVFRCGRFDFRIPTEPYRPLVMGILNVTPDSFSDGGHYRSLELALDHAQSMIDAGVDIIDIGGESSRPGALPLGLQEELDRVMPAVFALRDCGVAISVDTYKPEVMQEAVAAGADMINDIKGFHSDAAVNAVKDSDVGLCVMHMLKTPLDMQEEPEYADVFDQVVAFLRKKSEALIENGIDKDRIVLDPGFGFGKDLSHNLTLFKRMPQMLAELQLPLLAGVSRKSMIGEITGRTIEQRLAGSVAAALSAAQKGAFVVRVHDVRETVDALKVMRALNTDN